MSDSQIIDAIEYHINIRKVLIMCDYQNTK